MGELCRHACRGARNGRGGGAVPSLLSASELQAAPPGNAKPCENVWSQDSGPSASLGGWCGPWHRHSRWPLRVSNVPPPCPIVWTGQGAPADSPRKHRVPQRTRPSIQPAFPEGPRHSGGAERARQNNQAPPPAKHLGSRKVSSY